MQVTLPVSRVTLADPFGFLVVVSMLVHTHRDQVGKTASQNLLVGNLPVELRLFEIPDDIGSEGCEHGIQPAVGQTVFAVLPEEVEMRVRAGDPALLPFADLHATDLEVGPILG